jgi:hypothetical protein
MNVQGKPDAGNPHVRFDEGDQSLTGPYSTVSAVNAFDFYGGRYNTLKGK